MKILIIRHGDPDYTIDHLTPKGHREAKLLAERIAPLPVRDYYVSTMGRAKATAAYTLELAGRDATYCDWMREFQGVCIRPDTGTQQICWDWLPQDWTADPRFFDKDHWWEPEAFASSNVKEQYDYVVNSLDELLARYGYEYSGEGIIYNAVEHNNDTIVLFCHFGVQCIMLSHLLGVSPMILLHGMISAPTGVTTVITEERRTGKTIFRINAFGDISHLNQGNEPAAFAGRFCECYGNPGERI